MDPTAGSRGARRHEELSRRALWFSDREHGGEASLLRWRLWGRCVLWPVKPEEERWEEGAW